jgi:hypothetical protein
MNCFTVNIYDSWKWIVSFFDTVINMSCLVVARELHGSILHELSDVCCTSNGQLYLLSTNQDGPDGV